MEMVARALIIVTGIVWLGSSYTAFPLKKLAFHYTTCKTYSWLIPQSIISVIAKQLLYPSYLAMLSSLFFLPLFLMPASYWFWLFTRNCTVLQLSCMGPSSTLPSTTKLSHFYFERWMVQRFTLDHPQPSTDFLTHSYLLKLLYFSCLLSNLWKNTVTYKVFLTLVTLTVTLSLPVSVLIGYARGILCHELCMGLDGRGIIARSSAIIYSIFYMGAWIVSVMMIVMVSYIGLLVLYKKGALHGSRGEGHGISLKITTLPVIMPFVIKMQVVPFLIYLWHN